MAGGLITLRPLMRWLRDVSQRVSSAAKGVASSSNRTQTSSSVEQKHPSPIQGLPDIEAAMSSHPSLTEEPRLAAGAI